MTISGFWTRRRERDERLIFPLAVSARIAILDARFRLSGGMRIFGSSDLQSLIDYEPEALVAPSETVLMLAARKLDGSFHLPSLQFAILALSSLNGPLTTGQRDDLWTAFGVPVFEQLVGSDGKILARECEVHDGLHFEGSLPSGVSGEIITEQCECGLESPRLLNIRMPDAQTTAA